MKQPNSNPNTASLILVRLTASRPSRIKASLRAAAEGTQAQNTARRSLPVEFEENYWLAPIRPASAPQSAGGIWHGPPPVRPALWINRVRRPRPVLQCQAEAPGR